MRIGLALVLGALLWSCGGSDTPAAIDSGTSDGSCVPSCTDPCAADDGCGVPCCPSGICSAQAGCAAECFAGTANDNLDGAVATAGATASGGLVCNESGALTLGDSSFAGLAYGGTAVVTIDGVDVTSCVTVDMGQACLTGDSLGIGYSFQRATNVCGDSGGNQCNVLSLCGSSPGVGAALFIGFELSNMRYLFGTGSCGEQASVFGTPSPIQVPGEPLPAVRYLMLCRPAEGCDASGANIEVDALFLAYRPR